MGDADIIGREVTVAEAQVAESSLLHYVRWALYLTVACLPLYVVRWHYGPLPTTLLETLIIVTVVLYVAMRWREGVRRPTSTIYDIPILMLLLAGAISVFVAKDHRGALGLYRAYFIEPVALFYVAVGLLRQAEQRLNVVRAFAVGSSAFAALNLGAFVHALAIHILNVGTAPSALYDDANPVAMFLEPALAFALGFLFFGSTLRMKVMGAVWLAFVGSALVATFSKGSYAALLVLAVITLLTVRRWRLPLLGALAAGAVIATQIPLLYARLATTFPSINGRQEIFRASIDMIRAHPLFGVGLGGYTYLFRGVTPEIFPHNIWLTFWVEIGLLGLVAFAVIFFMLQWTGWRAWSGLPDIHRAEVWGVLGGLALWFTHGLVDSPYWKNDMSAEFWIIAALLLSTLTAARNLKQRETEKVAA